MAFYRNKDTQNKQERIKEDHLTPDHAYTASRR